MVFLLNENKCSKNSISCYNCNENIGPSTEFGTVTCMNDVKKLQKLHEYIEDNQLQDILITYVQSQIKHNR